MFDQMSVGDLVSMASAQPILAADEEDRLVRRLREGDVEAVEQLVLGHLRIAIDEAIRIRGLGLAQRELVRVGVRTLVEAAMAYDPAEHGRFAIHARSAVRRAMIQIVGVS